LLVHYPRDRRDEFIQSAMKLMTIPFELKGRTITIPVDAAIGTNWGDYNEEENPNGLKAYEPAAA